MIEIIKSSKFFRHMPKRLIENFFLIINFKNQMSEKTNKLQETHLQMINQRIEQCTDNPLTSNKNDLNELSESKMQANILKIDNKAY